MQIFFTQGIAVLCSQAPELGSLRHLFEQQGFGIATDEDATEWAEMQGAGFTLKAGLESKASVSVDICNFPWPDDMGAGEKPTLLGSAHALGAFGPFVQPGAFERALQAPGYKTGAMMAHEHRAFVRFRVSHFFKTDADAEESRQAQPDNAQPVQELAFLVRAAAALSELQEAVAYFNPNCELLLPMEGLSELVNNALEHKTCPVEAIVRLRGCPVEESWSFVDSIGMAQLGLCDHEFAWDDPANTRTEQIHFLVDLLHYQADNAVEFKNRHTTDGPHERLWRAEERENSCMEPDRKVLHWTVEGAAAEPDVLATKAPAETSNRPSENEITPEFNAALSKIEAWQPMKESIRARAVNWLLSPAFRTVYYDDAHVPFAMKVALEKEMSRKMALETWEKLQYLGQQTPELWEQYQQLATRGQVWFAVPLMTNPAFKTESHALLPCGVIVATEQTSSDILRAGIFGMVAYDLYTGEGDAKKFPGTARIMSDDSYRLFYREAFPLSETQGSQFILLCLLLRKSWMPPEDVPFIPLLAIPGPHGAVVQIPWHIAAGTPPLPGSVEPGRFAEIAAFDRMADQMLEEERKKNQGCGGLLRKCWTIIYYICLAVFLLSILSALIVNIFEKLSGSKKASEPQKKTPPAVYSSPK